MTMLTIKSLSKTYRDRHNKTEVIKNITVSINDGEFVCFVGPSGCGKTTLLKCIAGILKPENGHVVLDNKNMETPDKSIGMVFQDFSLFPWLTLRKNIEFGLKLKNTPAEERNRIVEHYLGITGLKDFADAFPKSLSGGMKQRVAVARTLANDPRVVLMDEPFGSLDSLTRASMQEFLTTLWEKTHKTVVFVTHDVEEALFLADKIYVLSDRPASIRKCFHVVFKRPRQQSLKRTQEFFEFRNRIMDSLIE